MPGTMIDSNVLLDVLTEDPLWCEASSAALEKCADQGELYINAVIYAEVSIGFAKIEDVEAVLSRDYFGRLSIPPEAAFLAGKAFAAYRRCGGQKTSTLPDFFIGAHAAVLGLRLLTRDVNRYRTYFPGIDLIIPKTN